MLNLKSGSFLVLSLIALSSCGSGSTPPPSTTTEKQPSKDNEEVLPALFSNIVAQRTSAADQKAKAERLAAAAAEAEEKIESVQNEKPPHNELWKHLLQGEFEAPEAFKERQEKERTKEEAVYEKALCEWQTRFTLVQKERAQMQPHTQENVKAIDMVSRLPSTIQFSLTPRGKLERFGQYTMRFPAVNVNYISRLLTFQAHTYGQVRTQELDRLSFKASSLTFAQKFKELYESGRVRLIIEAAPEIEKEESPVQTGSKTALEYGNLAENIIIGIISEGQETTDKPLTKTETVYDREGVLYHVILKVRTVHLTDSDGNQVPGISVENE